jgi:hypothetical protein
VVVAESYAHADSSLFYPPKRGRGEKLSVQEIFS